MKKEKAHLPVMGVGPIYVYVIALFTLVGVILSKTGIVYVGTPRFLRIPFIVTGAILILFGIFLWVKSVIIDRIDESIKKNCLKVSGIYAYVRNPIYSAFMFLFTGILFIFNDAWLLLLPLVFWAFLTVFMKITEEKWLLKLYGDEYRQYCKRVNRCIPWFPKK